MERLETARLILRRPLANDAEAIFTRYASDPEVTRYLAWPRHESLDATRGFLGFSDAQWTEWSCGPYVIESRAGVLLGSTGLTFDADGVSTGYVLARDAWGRGIATEALRAMLATARGMKIERVAALCHAEHAASARVLEKCGFSETRDYPRRVVFPNLAAEPQRVRYFQIEVTSD